MIIFLYFVNYILFSIVCVLLFRESRSLQKLPLSHCRAGLGRVVLCLFYICIDTFQPKRFNMTPHLLVAHISVSVSVSCIFFRHTHSLSCSSQFDHGAILTFCIASHCVIVAIGEDALNYTEKPHTLQTEPSYSGK